MHSSHRYGKSMQFAWVVKDLNEAISHWNDLGVGPFIVFKETLTSNRVFYHRGKASPVQIIVALSYLGDAQIELIQQINDAPSTYKEKLDSTGEGFHHVSFWPKNCEEAVEEYAEKGWNVVAKITTDGTPSATYLQGNFNAKHIVEFSEPNADRIAYFSKIKDMCVNWDGKNGVMVFKDRNEFLSYEP